MLVYLITYYFNVMSTMEKEQTEKAGSTMGGGVCVLNGVAGASLAKVTSEPGTEGSGRDDL